MVIVHRYEGLTQWTLCGRWLGLPTNADLSIIGSDKAHEVTCKACMSRQKSENEEAGAEKQSKQVITDE